MSSIYKKGRDGYYYYQTYVYNPESKKKDKRVFHALRTKDSVEAKSKQHELDMQYEDKSYIDSNSVKPSINFSPRSTMAIIIAAISITIIVGNFFKINTAKQNRSVSIVPKKVRELENKIDVVPEKPIINNQINSVTENLAEITNLKPKLVEPKVVIPKYTIERVYRLSDAFNQGKVYVTIDEKSIFESLMSFKRAVSNAIVTYFADSINLNLLD